MSSDFAFANDIRAAAALRAPRTSRMLLAASLAMLAAFLTWAHFAVLDDTRRRGFGIGYGCDLGVRWWALEDLNL